MQYIALALCLSGSLSLSLYLTFKSRLAHLLTQLFLRTGFEHEKHIAKVSWLACPCIGTPFTYRAGAECVAKRHAEEVCVVSLPVCADSSYASDASKSSDSLIKQRMAFEYTCMDSVTHETLLAKRSVRTIKNH